MLALDMWEKSAIGLRMSLLGRHSHPPLTRTGCRRKRRQQASPDPTCTPPHMPIHAGGGWNHQLGCRWRDRTGWLVFEVPFRVRPAIGELAEGGYIAQRPREAPIDGSSVLVVTRGPFSSQATLSNAPTMPTH